MRSLIPDTVRVMALTATATKSSRRDIAKVLRLVSPAIVATSPNKPNIKYSVQANPGTLEETFASLVEGLRQQRTSMGRTVIFCHTYDQCSRIYMYLVNRLGKEMTEPIGVWRDLPQYRMIELPYSGKFSES